MGTATFDAPDDAKRIDSCLPLLGLIRQRNATYQGVRPKGTVIDEIVIHDTDSSAERFEDTVRYLANPGDGREVSIHYIIGRETGQIFMMVPEEKRANHGESHNAKSIGIELWRNTKQSGYTDWQYSVLGQLVYDIVRRHRVPRAKIIGHGFFKANRRGEPKGFDWARLDDELDRLNEQVKSYDRSFAAF